VTRTAIVALSRRGVALARTLSGSLEGGTDLFLDRRFFDVSDNAQAFDLPLRPIVGKILSQYQAVILFLPVGAAIRLIAPYLQDKHLDPAVVCVDDAGRFAVSLVSGHVGGADRLAEAVGRVLGATPVVTSASHVSETLAVDLLGREFGWKLEADSVAVTRASAAVVNGDPVGIYQSAGETDWWPGDCPLPGNLTVYRSVASLAASDCSAALLISDESNPLAGEAKTIYGAFATKHLVLFRPGSLTAGMGCRRGVPAAELEQLLVATFHENNLSLRSLRCIATAELKQDEPGLLALAEKYGVPLVCFSSDRLNAVFPPSGVDPAGPTGAVVEQAGVVPELTRSSKAHSLLGIWGVSEPAAILASGSNTLLVPKHKGPRATVAVARQRF
jgi:cobalt-precorrin 5A hydrolase